MFILTALWCGIASVAALPESEHARSPSQPAAATTAVPAPSTPMQRSAPAAPAKADPTLISVPSNTLGPGLPLWVVREQAESDARIARAVASYAEARASLARVEAQAAADRPDLYFGGGYGGYGGYGGVVVYGPRRPGLSQALANRPIPRPLNAQATRPPLKPRVDAEDGFEDQHSVAQRNYAEAARPRIEASVEAQQEAQRKFAETAAPPIAKSQKQRDDAQLKIRKAPKSGQ